jgi:hypothetical protein
MSIFAPAASHVDEEDGQALGALLHLVERRRPREQEHQVGVERREVQIF